MVERLDLITFLFMADVHSKQVRSFNMSQIRAKNTKPEMLVRRFLFSHGYRYKLHDKSLPGCPDLVLPKYRTVIFVHGCFWHGHDGCRYFKIPKTRTDWWREKIERNIERDNDNELRLAELGWKIIVVYECQLQRSNMNNTLSNVIAQLH